ncbi:MAG: DNA mismatch repair protein MutS [Proteobacteria bacterium]|nr:DNA mismatch repair protein MutS [Pseudomonadota bacterium]
MKVYFLFKDRDFDLNRNLIWNESELIKDLELKTLLNAMAQGDKFLFEVGRKVLLSSLTHDKETIHYRQEILKDCLKNDAVIRKIDNLAMAAIASEKKNWLSMFLKNPSAILSGSRERLQSYLPILQQLNRMAHAVDRHFESPGFTRFFTMLKNELNEQYFLQVQYHLQQLKLSRGVLLSAQLGQGNKGVDYVLHQPPVRKRHWLRQMFDKKPVSFTFYLAPRDEMGAKALSELQDQGLNIVANTLAQSCDHILDFFKALHTELSFYIGCLNLHKQLTAMDAATVFPSVSATPGQYTVKKLYDVCLALKIKKTVVSNDLNADNKNLIIITGANRGGKSVFLRSIGLAQLMMQCGMFVPAEFFSANICCAILTHYKKEEDVGMKSGKFDEELNRMNELADHITSNSMILFNESFSATNDREGSEIATQIVTALLEKNIKIFFVTHLYEFAHRIYDTRPKETVFLRAERNQSGKRTYKLYEAIPLPTSYGKDLYVKIFESPSIHET